MVSVPFLPITRYLHSRYNYSQICGILLSKHCRLGAIPFLRGGRGKRERGVETLAALPCSLGMCDIGGYKEGVDVAILSFHWLY